MKKRFSLILALVITLVGVIGSLPASAATDLEKEKLSGSVNLKTIVDDGKLLKTGSAQDPTFTGPYSKKTMSYNGYKCFYLPKKPNGKYTNPLTVTFYDCGDINGHRTKIVVEVVEVRFGKEYDRSRSTLNSKYATFFLLKKNSFSLGTPTPDAGCPWNGMAYGGEMYVKTRTTVYDMDTDKIIKYPFAVGLSDIDKYPYINGHYVAESHTVGDMFYKYYYWSQNILTINDHTFSANAKTDTGGQAQEGDAQSASGRIKTA